MEPVYIVTLDKWAIERGGIVDATDLALRKEAGFGAQYITPYKLMDELEKDDKAKFKKLHAEMEKQAGKTLSPRELRAFASRANEAKSQFDKVTKHMNFAQAGKIRHWRVDEHRTWRSLARETYDAIVRQRDGWQDFWNKNGPPWSPPSNQIAGMAIAERAAGFFKEDFMKEPWN